MVQDHEVVFRKGDKTVVLTKNVVLPSGIRINYQNGIVELPDGKTAALKEGDIVKMSGEIVPGSPVLQASEATIPLPDTARRTSGDTSPAPAAKPAATAVPAAKPRIK